jgi:PPOX class probable F420-dependent enzyme
VTEDGLDKVRRLVAAEHGLCTFVCLGADGAPHTSVVNAGVMDHPVSGETSVALVVRANAAKIRLMRADPRCAVTFRHSWDWVAVHGNASLIGLDDPAEGFDTAGLPTLLREVFQAAGGTHDDWDTYDQVMAEERRLAVFVSIGRIAANTGSIS